MTAQQRRFSTPVRRGLLTVHVIASVGWLGVTLADLVLAITVATTADPLLQHSIFRVLEVIGGTVLLPISLAALVTGVALSLGTPWGLIRYRWVAIKFVLTAVTVVLTYVLLVPGINEAAAIVADTAPGQLAPVRESTLLAAACVSTTVYTINVVLSIFKPWGRTRWGNRAVTGVRGSAGRSISGATTAREVGSYT